MLFRILLYIHLIIFLDRKIYNCFLHCLANVTCCNGDDNIVIVIVNAIIIAFVCITIYSNNVLYHKLG